MRISERIMNVIDARSDGAYKENLAVTKKIVTYLVEQFGSTVEAATLEQSIMYYIGTGFDVASAVDECLIHDYTFELDKSQQNAVLNIIKPNRQNAFAVDADEQAQHQDIITRLADILNEPDTDTGAGGGTSNTHGIRSAAASPASPKKHTDEYHKENFFVIMAEQLEQAGDNDTALDNLTE